jgi:hypothetical protein
MKAICSAMTCLVALILWSGCEPEKIITETTPESEQKPIPRRLIAETNGDVSLKLDLDTQAGKGLKTEIVTRTNFVEELTLFGHVLDSSSLVIGFNEWASTLVAQQASERELARLKLLRSQNNASDRAVEAGEAAFRRDLLAVLVARQKLESEWGKLLVSRPDFTNIVRRLSEQQVVVVRLDSALERAEESVPPKAMVFRAGVEAAKLFSADLLGPARSIDPSIQGVGYLYLVDAASDLFPIGAAVEASVVRSNNASKKCVIPRSAVIAHDGLNWYYEQSNDQCFKRRPVLNGIPRAEAYLIPDTSERSPRVVTVGAQQLLSEELKAQLQSD